MVFSIYGRNKDLRKEMLNMLTVMGETDNRRKAGIADQEDLRSRTRTYEDVPIEYHGEIALLELHV